MSDRLPILRILALKHDDRRSAVFIFRTRSGRRTIRIIKNGDWSTLSDTDYEVLHVRAHKWSEALDRSLLSSQ